MSRPRQLESSWSVAPIPTVSVIMPTFNDAPTLSAAVDSILAQTYRAFEFIIIDDASTDETHDLLMQYARQDGRIRLLRNNQNLGLSQSLNRGLERARGELIARMDSDDRSAPERLERQVSFLQDHPEIGLLGTQPRFIDDAGRPLPHWTWTAPTCHDAIAWQLLDSNPLVHPSVVIRAGLLRAAGGYDPAFPRGQDMELWTRLVMTTRCANLDESFVDYRVSVGSFATKLSAMAPLIQQVAQRYVERLLERAVSVELLRVVFQLNRNDLAPDTPAELLIETSLLLVEIFAAMCHKGILELGEAGPAHERMQLQVQRLVAAAQASRVA